MARMGKGLGYKMQTSNLGAKIGGFKEAQEFQEIICCSCHKFLHCYVKPPYVACGSKKTEVNLLWS
jgi:hypothetical protein